MEIVKSDRGKKLFEARVEQDLFEVYEHSDKNYPYAGYFNGKLSVTATHPATALRGLQRKHIPGLPEGELIEFAEEVKRLNGRYGSHRS